MVKIIRCTKCHRRIKVEGLANDSKEVPQQVTCPYCNEPNELMWPMGGGYIVTPAD